MGVIKVDEELLRNMLRKEGMMLWQAEEFIQAVKCGTVQTKTTRAVKRCRPEIMYSSYEQVEPSTITCGCCGFTTELYPKKRKCGNCGAEYIYD